MKQSAIPTMKIFNIMSSNICNGSCLCCQYRSTYKKDFEPMKPAVWNRIVYDLYEMRNKTGMTIRLPDGSPFVFSDFAFHFGWLDEPLCDPNIVARVRDLKKIGFWRIGIITNASLLTHDRLVELNDSGVGEFYISLLDARKENFEALTGLNFGDVVTNINKAIPYLESKGAMIKINAALDSWDDAEHFRKIFPESIINKYVFFNIRDDREKKYKVKKIKWNESCFLMMAGKNNSNGCDVGASRFLITYDGGVPMCNLDYKADPIGNVMTETIPELITRQMALVLNRAKSEPKPCRDCYIPQKHA